MRVFKQDEECVYLLMVVMGALWPGELVAFTLVHYQQYPGEMNSVRSITIWPTKENTTYGRVEVEDGTMFKEETCACQDYAR